MEHHEGCGGRFGSRYTRVHVKMVLLIEELHLLTICMQRWKASMSRPAPAVPL